MIDVRFRPGSLACCLARLDGRNNHLGCLEKRNIYVEQNDPKPEIPRPASLRWGGCKPEEGGPTREACPESCRRAQLRQGLPIHESI